MNEVMVEFTINETKIRTATKMPMSVISSEEGLRIMTINNAIDQVHKDTGLNLYILKENIHDYAAILY